MDRQDLKPSDGPAEIFQALLNARDNGLAIGIRAGSCESEVLVTAVEDIELNENGTFIILKHFDSNGYILPSRRLALDDIQSVLPFSTVFGNPYLQNISRDKTWFF